jgi:hypothetical protein
LLVSTEKKLWNKFYGKRVGPRFGPHFRKLVWSPCLQSISVENNTSSARCIISIQMIVSGFRGCKTLRSHFLRIFCRSFSLGKFGRRWTSVWDEKTNIQEAGLRVEKRTKETIVSRFESH